MPVRELSSARIAYDDEGTGPAVLWLQGVGVSRVAWSPQTSRLASRYRCVAPDHRGIGGSEGSLEGLSVDRMAHDTLELVEQLGIQRMHVVGHSLGGVVAQRVALLAPESTVSLALMCTFAGGRDLARPTGRLMWRGMWTRLGTFDMRRRAFARLVMPDAYVEAKGIDAVVAELEAVFGRSLAAPDVGAISDRQLAALRAHDERARLAELARIPTLVQAGELDPIAPPRVTRALAAAIPGATYRAWSDASHALPIQHADAVTNELVAHFESAQR